MLVGYIKFICIILYKLKFNQNNISFFKFNIIKTYKLKYIKN
jgi:hypothetical protein